MVWMAWGAALIFCIPQVMQKASTVTEQSKFLIMAREMCLNNKKTM